MTLTMAQECTTPRCPRPHIARGLCDTHYSRVRRAGLLPPPPTIAERFWSKVNFDGSIPEHRPALGPCWLWAASVDGRGYGQFQVGKNGQSQMVRAHRWAYEFCEGPIPSALDLDHLCLVAICVESHHLEPVNNAENARRRAATQTHCKRGHFFDEANTRISIRGHRICRTCHRLREAGAL